MKITLTSVQRYTTKKDGSPLVSAQGKPYTSIRIKAQEHGDKLISGFGNQENASWKVGDTVEVDIEQKGEYLNFSTQKKSTAGLNEAQAYQIKQASESAYAANLGIQALTKALIEAGVIKDPHKFVGNTDIPYPQPGIDDIDPESVPF